MINRFRKWLHRDCQLERGTASALLTVGQELAAVSGGLLLLRQAFERVPERVTVIAFGQRIPSATGAVDLVRRVTREDSQIAAVPVVDSEPWIVVDSKTMRLRGDRSETITLETHFPVAPFQVVVLANFERVELAGLFHRTDLIGMQSPVGFGKLWHPGEQVRAVVRRLEVGE
jgi:hypothetical protein